MPKFFKKNKKKSKKDNRVYMPKGKNPSTNATNLRKKKRKFGIKKSKNNRRRKKKINFSALFFYIIVPLFFIALLYISIISILRIRGRGDDDETELQYVIGIEDVPAYPNSEFIFSNSIDEISVANFISSGNSAYRIPTNKSIIDIYKHYEDILPEYGWINVLSVEVGSEEMKSGEYWVKDNRGLRIFSKFNDIWYESITPVQAYTGLRDRVEREIERDLLLASEEGQELLPDFPWVIDIPKEYIISYSTSEYESFRSVNFRKLGTEQRVVVTPVGRMGEVLDNYLTEYIEILNSSEDSLNWTVTNTVLSYTNYGRALKGTITSGSVVHDVAVVPNTYNNVIYVIDGNTSEDPFFDYVFSNLKPLGLDED
jgi:hypothetical protein